VHALEKAGVETRVGDLKDRATLSVLCAGVDTLICTASSTRSRQLGDSIATVDKAGQTDLIEAAMDQGVKHFILVSFPPMPLDFPLQDAKRQAEASLCASGLGYTILRPSFFLEIWFSAAMGFDPAAARRARLFGDGLSPHSWVSLLDVRDAVLAAMHNPLALGRVLPVGGPEHLSQEAIVRRFESFGGPVFMRERVPVEAIEAQYRAAVDPLERSFAALSLLLAQGTEALNMTETLDILPYRQRSIDRFVRACMA
jgi:uncharacterized protein YbjT (DUF2867 family)